MTTYRIAAPGETLATGVLLKCKFVLEECGHDVRPRDSLWARYYCHNSECPVRRIDVDAVWPEGDRPNLPEFECPSCRKGMDFIAYLTQYTLVPVE